jgi:hypothetical protein
MGYCNTITSVSVDDEKYETYGEVMALLGDEVIPEDGNAYYEYPDSVLLDLEQIKNLPNTIHSKHSCCGNMEIVKEELDPNTIYLSYGYSR